MIPLSLLFTRVFQLGATAYGGPAMIAQIKETAVNRYGWGKEEEFMRSLALCQLIPGVTMVQMVTYIGYRVRGIWGAGTAADAFALPAFIALLALSAIYFKYHSLWLVQALFKGLGSIVVAIILNACITFGKSILKDWKVILIAVLSFFAAVAGLLLRLKKPQTKAAPSGMASIKMVKGKEYVVVALLVAFICLALVLSYLVDPKITILSLNLSKIGT